MVDNIIYPSRVDRPYRAAPDRGTIEDRRRAIDRTNERIDQLVTRVKFLEANQPIGIGGMELLAGVAGADITATWQPLTQFDTITVPATNLTLNPSAGTFTVNEAGTWQLALNMFFTHNEINAGREFFVRLIDIVTSNQVVLFGVGVGRNVGTSNVSGTRTGTVTVGVGNPFRFEIGGGSTFSTVFYEAMSFTALKVEN